MADDPKKKEEKKDDKKPAKDAKAPEAKADSAGGGGGKGGLIGIVLGLVVLAGAGAGAGMYIVKALSPAPVSKPGEAAAAAGGGHGTPAAHGDGGGTEAHAADGHDGGLLGTGVELDPIDLRANITGSGGTRYVTLSVGVWVPKTDQPKLADPSIRRLIQSRMEETLRTYQLEDLQSPNIQARLKKDFATSIEQRLRSIMPSRPAEQKFVLEITPTALLTQ
jgi:hypothetical protein